MALLEVRDVTLRFGGIVALDGVSFDVEEGDISGLIGPNGAGKTTAFNVITRLYKPDAGDVLLDGSSLLKAPAHKIVRKGVARTFQNIQLFRTMSVLENVLVGAHGRGRKVGAAEALAALDVVGLRDRALFPAAALPYGIQKRVELARALVAKPRLLLLDEPAGGLNHEEVAELGSFIQKIRDDFELTVLARRAPHEPRHEHLRRRERHELRPSDRERPPGAGSGRPRRDRGLPRLGRRARGPAGCAACNPEHMCVRPDRRPTPRRRRVKTLLELDAVTARYGPVQALHDVSLVVREGEVVAVLGANGAGKTTTLRAISGTVSRTGTLELEGKRLRGGPEAAARAGVAHVPEGRGTFVDLTVTENLKLGAYTSRNRSLKADITRIAEYFPWMTERGNQRAGTLSGGEQQMLALGRALMSRPRLLLLDEPSLGLAPMIVREFFRIVRDLNEKEGLTVLVVEQDARIALRASQRAYVLEVGRVALTGTSDELQSDESVRRSYLGY